MFGSLNNFGSILVNGWLTPLTAMTGAVDAAELALPASVVAGVASPSSKFSQDMLYMDVSWDSCQPIDSITVEVLSY